MNRNNGRKIAERLMLLYKFFIENTDRTHAVSMEDIRRFYLANSIEGESKELVEVKTVYRDLDAIGAYFGLDIEYSRQKKGYILKNPPFEAYELRHIIDSVQASKFLTQSEADKLTRSIKEHFGNGERLKLDRKTYVYDRIRSQNDSVVKDTDRLHEAITADRKIGFLYFHMRPGRKREYTNGGKPVIVSPFALYWNGGNLYLYAYDGKKFRYYRVDRMERISVPLQDPREGKDLFSDKNLTSQQAKVFQMYAGKPYDVKMRFLNTLTDAVIDQFGRDLVMIPDGDDYFTFTARVEVSPTFYAWIAAFGRRAKIVSPPEAVEGMKDFLQKAAEMYKDDGNT